ncbi:hypothetical protein COL5a_005840 [Colletotrichum fioriniae]|nr:hypothetical protein COL5a_005840 [Colletotrichum fioriniae]
MDFSAARQTIAAAAAPPPPKRHASATGACRRKQPAASTSACEASSSRRSNSRSALAAATSGSGEYTMDVLETTYLLRHPSHEEIHERCDSPTVKPFMNRERIKAKPVYMITGLKIAKGFAVKQSSSSDKAAHAQVGAEVSPEVSVGAGVSGSKSQREQHEFEAMQDIIFGYQLLKIEPKGWGKRKQLHYGEFMKRKKSAIKDPESVDGEASLPAAGEFQEMGTDIQSVTLDDGDAGHGAIVFQAPDEEEASE